MAEKVSSDENDDWETLDDNGELDKQIDALEKQSLAAKKKKEKADAENGLQYGKVTILQNSDQRTQYIPTIKLLKRDPAEPAANTGMGERKGSYKTLQQREAEYAEARKRILGDGEATEGADTEEESCENSPRLAPRITTMVEKPDKVLSRQPLGPDTNSKGFKARQPAVEGS